MFPNDDPNRQRRPKNDDLPDDDDLPGGDRPDGPGDDREEFRGRTYLYIRTHPLDNGTEPLAAGLPFWISPDIRLIKPNNTDTGEAVPSQVNRVEVIVTNAGGILAPNAFVEVFVNDPTTTFTPATAVLVGSGHLTIPGYSTALISFNWTPSAADGGHRCLVARVSLILPPDTFVNPTIFDVVGDRHVAQRNIHVLVMPQGVQKLSFPFKVAGVVQAGAVEQRFLTQVREIHAAEQPEFAQAILGVKAGAQINTLPLRNVQLTVAAQPVVMPADVPPHALRLVNPNPINPIQKGCLAILRRFFPTLNTTYAPAGPIVGGREVVFTLSPGTIRQGELTLERVPQARPGDIHLVNIIQIDATTGYPAGGLLIVVRYE